MLVEWFAGETAERYQSKQRGPRGNTSPATYSHTYTHNLHHCCSKAYTRGRPHIAFRHNMFEHIGARSTLRTSASPQYAACYEQLLDPVLFEVLFTHTHTHTPPQQQQQPLTPLLALLRVACRWRRLNLASVATLTFGPAHLATPKSCTQPWTGSSWGPKSRGFPACNRLQICLLACVCVVYGGLFQTQEEAKCKCCCNKHANHSSAFLAARRGSSIAA